MGVADADQTAAASAAVVTVASGKPTASMAKQGGYAVLAKRTLHAAIKLIKLGGARCQVMLIACPRHVRAEAVAERYGFRHRYAVHGRHTRVHPASFPSFTHPFHPRILRHRRIAPCCARRGSVMPARAGARSALGDCVRARPCTNRGYELRKTHSRRTGVTRSHIPHAG